MAKLKDVIPRPDGWRETKAAWHDPPEEGMKVLVEVSRTSWWRGEVIAVSKDWLVIDGWIVPSHPREMLETKKRYHIQRKHIKFWNEEEYQVPQGKCQECKGTGIVGLCSCRNCHGLGVVFE